MNYTKEIQKELSDADKKYLQLIRNAVDGNKSPEEIYGILEGAADANCNLIVIGQKLGNSIHPALTRGSDGTVYICMLTSIETADRVCAGRIGLRWCVLPARWLLNLKEAQGFVIYHDDGIHAKYISRI